MKISKIAVVAALMSTLSLTGCIDDDYDLSDIDGTAELKVNDLVLPLNIDEITLSNIFELGENSRIQIINGEYVLTEDGTFSSQNIKIPEINVTAPYIEPTRQLLELNIDELLPSKAIDLPNNNLPSEFYYTIDPSKGSEFSYKVGDVSEYITSIIDAEVEMSMTLKMSVTGLEDVITGFEFSDMEFNFPKGLTLEYDTEKYNYDTETGVFKFNDSYCASVTGMTYELNVKATKIDFEKANAEYDATTHTMTFTDEVAIVTGKAHVQSSDFKPGQSILTMPSDVYFELEFVFSDLKVNKVSGGVLYAIDGVDIAPIDLNDIPDFINQEGTDIKLDNPQLYIAVNNPVAHYGLAPEMGLTITQVRNGSLGNSYSIDNGAFKFATELGNVVYNYCLSPAEPTTPQAGYENYIPVPFTDLSKIVSGDGIPSALNVTVDNPNINGDAINFDLGQELELSGNYLFYAPLDLAEGSTIVYTDTRDGWADEDLNKLTINEMSISAIVSSDVPFGVTLNGNPIDTQGNKIDAVVEPVTIEANAKDAEILLRITGDIKHLDGITFIAKAVADGSKPFGPDQKLSLKDVKVKVSGSYTDEF